VTQHGMEELEFEWDEGKAALNLMKHGVTFKDPDRANEKDEREDHGEERWKTSGMTRDRSKTLVVVYTPRMENGVDVVRLISAWSIGDRGRRRYGYRDTKVE